jgi:hypothetical protein
MPEMGKELLERYIAEQLSHVYAEIDLTTEMLQRSREQIAKSVDILRSTEVPKVWHPEPPASAPIAKIGTKSHSDNMGRDVSLATNRE